MNIKKNIAKAICTVLTYTTLLSSLLTANAIETPPASESPMNESSWTVDEGKFEEIEVTYTQASSYYVTIPKIIILDQARQGKYSVKVTGDIDANQYVYVAPVDGIADTESVDFYMKDQASNNRKADVVAEVNQSKFYWNYEEVKAGYTENDNSIIADGLSAGRWKGIFQIEISMRTDPSHIHNYVGEVTKEPTCTEPGEKTYTCDCGESYTETIDPTDHHYGDDDKCIDCGELKPNHEHNYTETITKESTCTEEGEKTYICDCGDSYTEVMPATGHHYGDDDNCTNCGELKPNHEHNYTETITKEPTCTEDGSKKRTCSICGNVDIVTIPMGHSYVDNTNLISWENTSNGAYAFVQEGTKWTSNNKAVRSSTATSAWTITLENDTECSFKYKVSSESGYDKLTIKLDSTTIANAISGAGEEITYTGTLTAGRHILTATYTKDSSSDKNDDCGYVILEEIGESNHKCTICGNKIAHSYGEYEITKEATCTEEGSKTRTCSACGRVDTVTIPAGHSYASTFTIDKTATCTVAGSKSKHCTRSGCTAKTEITTIPASHSYDNPDRKCTVCGEIIAPSEAISNWNYTLNETAKTVTLNFYTGSETDVIVYSSYEIGGKVYKTQLANNTSNASYTTSYMFNGYARPACKNIETITFSTHIDTSYLTNTSFMFNNCNSLTHLDIRGFDTSNVTNMTNMFGSCQSLTTFDVNVLDTSNAISMGGLFFGCESLSSIDLSSFDTSNATSMASMFSGCSSLTSLDISYLDTSKVTNMSCMFENCSSLTSLDVSSLDTSKVTNMQGMFRECSSLTNLDVSTFDTSLVKYMDRMFSYCTSLTSLDLSNFNTKRVTTMSQMFAGSINLRKIYISAKTWNEDLTGNSVYQMFTNCGTSSFTYK